MFPGVDTKKFYDFIQKLIINPHKILMCEGISSTLYNVQVLQRIVQTGYNLQLLEINEEPDICLRNILHRKNNEKSQQLFGTWKLKKTLLSKMHYIETKTKTDIHKSLFDEVNQSK